jgi:hypothetical protein
MKVIFLDFDGVLNSRDWCQRNEHLLANQSLLMHRDLDREAVGRVNRIVEATGAVVVVSSTWRLLNPLPVLKNILAAHGFTGEVLDVTPRLSRRRGHEIAAWLNSHGPVEGFVIIDDDSDMEHLLHKLVQTSWESGLQDEHVERAVKELHVPWP